ncbi:MAG: hypothetical protein U0271_44025 [Polyangiaceae bacterium]
MKTISILATACVGAMLLAGCSDDASGGAGGSGASGGAGGSNEGGSGGSVSSSTGGAGGAGGAGCAPTVCQDANITAQVDPITAFGLIQGLYQGHPNAQCAESSLTQSQFTTNKTLTLQVDSGGSIFLSGDGVDYGWNFLTAGDCDFACADGEGTTWVSFQDDSSSALTSTVTFGVRSDGSPTDFTLHANPDCSVTDLIKL